MITLSLCTTDKGTLNGQSYSDRWNLSWLVTMARNAGNFSDSAQDVYVWMCSSDGRRWLASEGFKIRHYKGKNRLKNGLSNRERESLRVSAA